MHIHFTLALQLYVRALPSPYSPQLKFLFSLFSRLLCLSDTYPLFVKFIDIVHITRDLFFNKFCCCPEHHSSPRKEKQRSASLSVHQRITRQLKTHNYRILRTRSVLGPWNQQVTPGTIATVPMTVTMLGNGDCWADE